MKRVIAAGFAALLVGGSSLGVSGCASMPEPCTSEWVHWKTERFISEFVHDHRSSSATPAPHPPCLRSPAAPATSNSSGILTPILTAAADHAGHGLRALDLWPEVRDALSQCDTASGRRSCSPASCGTRAWTSGRPGRSRSWACCWMTQLQADRGAQPEASLTRLIYLDASARTVRGTTSAAGGPGARCGRAGGCHGGLRDRDHAFAG